MNAIKYLIILAIIILGVAPWGVGMLAENRYKQMVDQINSQYGDELKVSGQFDRGYFSSNATTEITNLKTGDNFKLINVLHNGPVIFRFNDPTAPNSYLPVAYGLALIDTKLTGPLQDLINVMYGDKPSYDIITKLNYFGSGTTTIKFYPLHSKNAASELNWDGGQYVANFDKNFVKFDGHLNIPNLNYSENVSSLKIKQVDGMYDATPAKSNFKLNIAQIAVSENDLNVYELQNFMLEGDGTIANNILNGNLTYKVATINTASDQYGPVDVKLKIQNIDPDLANDLSNATEITPETDQKLLQLLSHKPMFDLNLQAATPQGNVNAVTHLEVGGTNLSDVAGNTISKTLKINADLKIAAAIVNIVLEKYVANEIMAKEKIYFMQHGNDLSASPNPYVMTESELQAFAKDWVAKFSAYLLSNNYIISSNGDYVTNITYADEVLVVNGDSRTSEQVTALQDAMQVEVAPPVPVPAPTPESAPATLSVPAAPTPDQSAPTEPDFNAQPPVPTPAPQPAT